MSGSQSARPEQQSVPSSENADTGAPEDHEKPRSKAKVHTPPERWTSVDDQRKNPKCPLSSVNYDRTQVALTRNLGHEYEKKTIFLTKRYKP